MFMLWVWNVRHTFTRMCWSSFHASLNISFTISVVTEGERGIHTQTERGHRSFLLCAFQSSTAACFPCSCSHTSCEAPQLEWDACSSPYERSMYRNIFCSSGLQETNSASLFSDANKDAPWSVNTHIHLSIRSSSDLCFPAQSLHWRMLKYV